MKKFCLTALILGISLVIGGITIVGIFASQGYDFEDAFEKTGVGKTVDTITITGEYAASADPEESLHIYEDSYSHYYSSCDLKSIEIEAAAADIFIMSGDQLSVYGYGLNTKKFTEKVDDSGVLKIKYDADAGIADMLSSSKASVDITLPYGYALDDMSIKLDAGNASIVKIPMNELKVEINAGDLQITDASVLESSEIDITTGYIYLYGSELTNTEINSTAVSIYSSDNLRLKGKTYIELTAGNVYLTLAGDVSDYSYDISKGAGTVSIDGRDKIPDTKGKDTIKIKMTAGDVNISFE